MRPGPLAAVLVCPDEVLARRLEAVLAADGVAVARRVGSPDDAAEPLRASAAQALVLVTGSAHTARDALIARMRAVAADAAIVIVAPVDTRRGVRSALEAGVDGVVFRDDVDSRLAPTLRAACCGQVVVPRANRHELGRPSLSGRERQTLRLVVMGLSNKEIAGKLFLAESTVKCHLSSAFTKLGVRSRNEAIDLILDQGDELGLGILTMTRRAVAPPSPSA